MPFGERIKPVDDGKRALAIGLDDDAEPVPARKFGVRDRRLDDVERQVQPGGFLGVDVEADAGAGGKPRQLAQAGHQFGHDAGALGLLIARVQRRQLDRDARIVLDRAARCGP